MIRKAAHSPAFSKDISDEQAEQAARFLSEQIANGMGITEAFAELKKLYGAHYLRVFDQTRAALEPFGIAVDLPDVVARRVVEEGGRRLGLIDLDQQTRDALFEEILEARENGEGPDKIVQRIRDQIPAGPWADEETRATVIARTETLHAQRFSALEAYREAPNVSEVVLFDNRTGYDDEDCVARDGQVVSFEEAQQAMEDEHPQGTLAFAPVVGRSQQLAEEAEAAADA